MVVKGGDEAAIPSSGPGRCCNRPVQDDSRVEALPFAVESIAQLFVGRACPASSSGAPAKQTGMSLVPDGRKVTVQEA